MDAAQSQQALRSALETRLTPFVQRAFAAYGLAGLAVGVVSAGELVYARGFGVRSRATGEPVTTRSLFHLASVSKTLVATAVVQLAERGLVDLDAPVAAYLPYFTLGDPRYAAITVQQMLSHTSGLPSELGYAWEAPEDDEGALERFVRGLAGQGLLFAPGERFAYSNVAYEVLGDLVAKVSGASFEGYVKTNILDPLGMRDSTFLRGEVAPELAVAPHLGMPMLTLPGAYPYHRAHAPSSTLHSSVEELARWAVANMGRGSLDGAQILRPESYDLLWGRYVETGEQVWTEAVGLAWQHGTYHGSPTISHSGSDPGFSSELVILPEQDAAVMVFCNANTAATGSVCDAALHIVLGLEPEPPKLSIAVPVGAALAAAGPEAAAEQYHGLLAAAPERYDARPWRFFDAVWGALELHRPEVVLPLIRLWLTLQPDAALAHEAMGWAQLALGEREAAAASLRRALALDPEAEHAQGLLGSMKDEG